MTQVLELKVEHAVNAVTNHMVQKQREKTKKSTVREQGEKSTSELQTHDSILMNSDSSKNMQMPPQHHGSRAESFLEARKII